MQPSQLSTADYESQVTSEQQISGLLQKLVDENIGVTIYQETQADHLPTRYRSWIKSINPQTQSILLGKFTPAQDHNSSTNIPVDAQCWLEAKHLNGKIRFNIERLEHRNQADGKDEYQAEFPTQIHQIQRRSAYRVTIPNTQAAQLDVTLTDALSLTGELLDLSETGMKVRFPQQHSLNAITQKASQQNVLSAKLILADHTSFDCDLIIKHLSQSYQNDMLCGFSIQSMSPQAQRYLSRLITELQWQQREKIKNQQRVLSLSAMAG